MREENEYRGGEDFDLRQMLLRGRSMRLDEKVGLFDAFLEDLAGRGENLCMRLIGSAADREVDVIDGRTGARRRMLMFGSNNYLGLANHPLVRRRMQDAVDAFGAGVGGPPLLNGYTVLHHELEQRLAALKGTEDALLFSSGYNANVGLVAGLVNPDDVVLYDAYSHASFWDGIRMSGARAHRFPHNDMERLRALLEQHASTAHDTYVGVEGVYSMDGDCAPLDRVVELCERHGARLMLDDAHGTGVTGARGHGTAERFGVEGRVPLTMGTFSKTFAVNGAFVAASAQVVRYLRFFARSHMFSAALPPATVAAVLGGLEVLESEPGRLDALRRNTELAAEGLRTAGFPAAPQAAIIPLLVPLGMNIRRAAAAFDSLGIFVNSIEYPAVPLSQQRFRISLMATHTSADIGQLVEAVREVWRREAPRANREEPRSALAA